LRSNARGREKGFINVTTRGSGNEKSLFTVVCAWCGRGETRTPTDAEKNVEKNGAPTPALPISHTICDGCYVKERANVEQVVKARRKRTSA
jgi:hypothetical protein